MKRFLVLVMTAAGLLLPSPARAADPPLNAVFASRAADKATIAKAGFNTATANPYVEELDALQRHGLRAIVWLQGYVNEPSCAFSKSDDWLTRRVNGVKNHPAVLAWHVDDEPHGTQCRNAPAQIAARTALLHRLDPSHPVVLTHYREHEFDDFAGTADILGVVMYPCTWAAGCAYSKITSKVLAARRAGWTRLWGLPQTFGDEYYRMPTFAEALQILATWDAAGVTDRFTYTWDKTDPDTLVSHPDLWAAFRR